MTTVDVRLNAIVDPERSGGHDLADLARVLAEGGATLIQLRDKKSDTGVMLERARAIKAAVPDPTDTAGLSPWRRPNSCSSARTAPPPVIDEVAPEPVTSHSASAAMSPAIRPPSTCATASSSRPAPQADAGVAQACRASATAGTVPCVGST